MKINKVEIKNFYSFIDESFTFKYKGIVLLEGKNLDTGGSNGSGKSGLPEAVTWGIFGKTIRKSTEEAYVNNSTKKKCSIRTTVNDVYVIERGKRPTYLRFFKGKEELTQENAMKTQALIEETLQTNYKVFLATSVFGQQNNIEFINATPDDKRTIIKNFLNLEELFTLRDSVKHLKSEYSQTIKNQDAIIVEHEKSVKEFDVKLQDLTKKSKEYSGLIPDKNSEPVSLEDILKQEELFRKITSDIKRAKLESQNLFTEERKINSLLHTSICGECGTELFPVTPLDEVEDLLSKVCKKIASKDVEIEKLKDSLPVIPISSRKFAKVQEFQQMRMQENTFLILKQELLERIQDAHNIKQEFNSKYEIMRFWEKAFSEQGIVKYVIKNVLDYFNSKVNFYLAHLSQGKFVIKFDESLKETITHNKRDIFYMSLSGGEKKKISLAVMLGLQELLKISYNQENNLIFFDEVAESLDNEGLDGLYTLLSELKKDKCLFVITHNNYLKSLLDNSKTITMIKENGITKAVGK